jgi:hypothetical protein
MKRWIWILVSVSLSTAVYFVIRYGLRPKPIPVMTATSFERLNQIGAVVYRRLRQPVRAARLVLLGSSGEIQGDEMVWDGFLRAAAADKEKIVYFTRTGRPAVPADPAWEAVSFDESAVTDGSLIDTIKKRMKAGRLILIHDDSREVTHLVRGSLSHRLERMAQHPLLSISTLRLALEAPKGDAAPSPCLSDDIADTQRLDCAAAKVARIYRRKNLDPARIWAVIERDGLKEYLVFIHAP